MQRIKEIEEKRKTRNNELLKRLKYEELKRGIHKNKEDYEEEKSRRYVRKINQYYEIFEPYKHTEITEGSRKEGKHTYPTKSQIEWDKDNAAKYIFVKKDKISRKTGRKYQTLYKYRLNIESTNQELVYIKKSLEEEKINIPPRKEKVLLLMKNYCFYTEIKIYPSELSFYTGIKNNKEKIKLYVEKYFPEEEQEYKTIYGKMKGKELLKILLQTKVRMYKGYLENKIAKEIKL